jgi:outer membrane immunogenic protein
MRFTTYASIAALAVALAAPAVAADLPARAPAPAPVYAAPIFTWTGFYVGAEAGYGWGKHSRVNTVGFANGYTSDGATLGGYAGYNWQVAAFVLGLEGDLGYSWIKGNDNSVGGTLDETRLRWQGSLRARVGYLVTNNLLAYVAGGWAHGEFRHFNDGGAGERITRSRDGWTVGGGLEYAFTPNWLARVEYRYTDFGKYSNAVPANGILGYDVKNKVQEVRLGLAYKFGGPSAIVAKY